MEHTTTNNIKQMGEEVRRLVIEMSQRSKSGETGSSLSISDLLVVLYFKIMHGDPKNPNDPLRDRFVLSKGHGAAALYATLALRGYFPIKKLLGHRVNAGVFHGHPSKGAAPGIEVSTGSLGHGLSIAAGMAFALKHTKSKVYVLIGDGECNEGSIWEAALFIGNAGLPNIVAIIDDNKFQGFGATKATNRFSLAAQWKSFGWTVLKVDGHDPKEIEKKFKEAGTMKKPTVVIADTVSGKSIPHIEHTLEAHYYVPTKDDVAAASPKKKKRT
jgi:transketolase